MTDTHSPSHSGPHPAFALGFAAALTLLVALALHEFLAFGPLGHNVIDSWGARCNGQLPCTTVDSIAFGHIAKSLGAAMLFAAIGALFRWGVATLVAAAFVWVGQYFLSLIGMASAYRASFGTTWRWWEPFAELLWHPIWTPTICVTGVAFFWIGTQRLVRARFPS